MHSRNLFSGLFLSPFLLSACSGPFSTLAPKGEVAESISLLWWAMLAGAGVLFVLVIALFLFVMTRPDLARRIGARQWIIYGGLVLPGLVLPPLIGYSLMAGERVLPFPGQNVPQIHGEAFQWGWRFRYPDHGLAVTENLLYLPAGEPVDIHITSRDVIHSFWVPQLAGKMDAIPGKVNVMRLKADVAGSYQGICAEFCGLGHTAMRFDISVLPRDEISRNLRKETADE